MLSTMRTIRKYIRKFSSSKNKKITLRKNTMKKKKKLAKKTKS